MLMIGDHYDPGGFSDFIGIYSTLEEARGTIKRTSYQWAAVFDLEKEEEVYFEADP